MAGARENVTAGIQTAFGGRPYEPITQQIEELMNRMQKGGQAEGI